MADLTTREARAFTTIVLVPRVPGAVRHEQADGFEVRRFRYFPRRYEDLAHGAILDNLRARPTRWLQVAPLLVAEAFALRRLVREFAPDVVHVHWLLPQGLVARIVARRVPQVLTTLGGDVYALQGPLPRLLKGWVVRGASVLTAMNEDMRQRLIDLGADPSKTFVAPMGADVATVRAHAGGVERVGGRLLFAGRLVEKKGAAVLLDALSAHDGSPPWSLDLVGDGPLRAPLAARAAALGGSVRFLGTQDREALARSMGACEVFVLPSVPAGSGDQDGLPVVLLEAMAAGCAVVASRLPGIAEVVRDGVDGLLVPPGDASALRAAILRLLDDARLRTRLGTQASRASEAYGVEEVGARYVALLRSVAQGT